MFADLALGARIDRAEGRLCSRLATSGRASRHNGAMVLPISGGTAVYAGPRSPMNKLIGLGFDTPLDLAALAQIEDSWRAKEEPVRIELATLTDPAIGAQ